MESNEVEIEQSTTELKHFGFLKELTLKFLVVLSNMYDFAKENSVVIKTTLVSAESAIVSTVVPVYNKLKDLSGGILVFVDDKFDKYAPALAKKLVAKFKSLIDKTIPLVQKVLSTAQTIITPLITTYISLLQNLLKTIKPLVQKILIVTKSTPIVGKARTLLQKGFTISQTLLQNSINTTRSLVQDSVLQKGPELANQALDTTKSVVESIPLVGNVAQSLITNPADLANQAMDTTKSMVGGIPIVGNVAQSLITNPTDIANQVVNATDTLVKDNPVLGAVNSAAQNIVKEAQSVGTKAALQSAYTSFKIAGLPLIAQFWYKANTYPLINKLSELFLPMTEYLSEWYNKVVRYMDGKGYALFGYLPSVPIDEMKAAYKLVKTTMDGLSAVGDLVGMDDNN
ncbi:Rubber elongation factor [Artemisia annua]|uniref:Rubber elongation factor n=1 Tax=Artemisia annua TaxID=35608 RepID=A0A2U1PW31_ARTAN|nr:Rubber elongation factor [Artemisia annua]